MNFLRGLQAYMNTKISSALYFAHIGKRLNYEDNLLINDLYLTSDEQKKMSDSCHCFSTEDVLSKVHLFAISDGMGGHNAGEVASRICVEKLALAYEELQQLNSLKEVVNRLQTIIAEINNSVCDLSRKHDELKGMGATLVLFVVYEKECAVLNIGDSRAYYFNNNSLIQITKDHTEGQRMLELGLLTRKDISDFVFRKNLIRYIGYDQDGYILRADEYYPTIEEGMILLCSDGISDLITNDHIQEILRSESNVEIAGKRLISEAVSAYAADNATLILIPIMR